MDYWCLPCAWAGDNHKATTTRREDDGTEIPVCDRQAAIVDRNRETSMSEQENGIMAEQEARIASTGVDKLIDECIERLLPILTHARPVSTMRVPADAEHDDDLFVMMRLQSVKKRMVRASALSYEIGDTFIDFKMLSPLEQWTRIAAMLDEHGFRVVRK